LKGVIYVLDTDICIYIIKNSPPGVIKKFNTLYLGDVGISSVTMAELCYGANKSQYPDKNLSALQNFILPLVVLPFDDLAANVYGDVRNQFEKQGTPIGALDLMIASHAKSLGVTLVTNNTREFSRVPALKIENWTKL
jgi:tRNA(fMet)-specific endonuclease VapC